MSVIFVFKDSAEYVYASLLLHRAGREISEENVKRVLEAAGIAVDEIKVKALVAALKEIDIDEAIKSAALPAVAAPVAVAQPSAPVAVEEKGEVEEEEEEKEEIGEEELAAGLEALFG